jgi:GMP reductase
MLKTLVDNNKIVSGDKYLDFRDVLILPQASKLNSRSEVNLNAERNFTFSNSNSNYSWSGVPIVAANMTTVGTLEVYSVLSKYRIITALHKFYKLEDLVNYNESNPEYKLDPDYFMVSTGTSDENYDTLTNILDNFNCKFICIDIANGYIEKLKDFCKKVRTRYSDKIIMAGNVCTYQGTLDLLECGVDIVKCGIGGGSACTTRIQTGIGMPQLSCVLECSRAVEYYRLNNKTGRSAYMISDGGITCAGDVCKALGANADFVMIGGEFAGHDENPGELIEENGSKFKFFYGMSSSYAMKNNYAANNNKQYRSSEGREIKIKYRGGLDNTVQNFLGGIRSTCTYTDSERLDCLKENCKFILVNNQYNSNLVNGK